MSIPADNMNLYSYIAASGPAIFGFEVTKRANIQV